MNPLAIEIWVYIAIGYIFVSISIWIVARLSPIEWVNSKPPCTMACDHILEQIQKEYYKTEFAELTDINNKEIFISNNHHAHNVDDISCGQCGVPIPLSNDDEQLSDDTNVELVRIQNNFTLKNSFWFAIGALMQQGSDLYPRV